MLPPAICDLIEVFQDYLATFATQARRKVVFKILFDIEAVRVRPILALRIPFTAWTCIGSLLSFE